MLIFMKIDVKEREICSGKRSVGTCVKDIRRKTDGEATINCCCWERLQLLLCLSLRGGDDCESEYLKSLSENMDVVVAAALWHFWN